MVLKAMDVQVLIPRSHDVGKIQQLQVQQQGNHNHHTEMELRRDFSVQQKSVNDLEQMINDNIRDNGKEKNKENSRKEKNCKDQDDSEEEKAVLKHLGNNVDIHI